MSTPGSEDRFAKLRLSLGAIGAIALAFVVTNAALTRLAVWAERDVGVYSYAQEDWLRYLLPHMFDRFSEPAGPGGSDEEGPRILVTGPSAIREDVLPDRIEAEIQSARVYQGGISLGTLDDVNAALDYLAGAYGEEALPSVILLGLTPRFLSNAPDDRPFLPAIDRYSPYYSVEPGPLGPTLVPKGLLDGAAAWLRFRLTKQSDRYRTSFLAVAAVYVKSARSRCATRSVCPYGWPLRIAEAFIGVQRLADLFYLHPVTEVGIDRFLAIMTAPSKYRFYPPRGEAWLHRILELPDTFWRSVFAWDPRENEADTVQRMARLRAFAARHDIRLIAINLPENRIVDAYYLPGRYDAYLALIQQGLGDTPYVDMRRFLRQDEFIDAVHATPPGAQRFTDAIIDILETGRVPDRIPEPDQEKT